MADPRAQALARQRALQAKQKLRKSSSSGIQMAAGASPRRSVQRIKVQSASSPSTDSPSPPRSNSRSASGGDYEASGPASRGGSRGGSRGNSGITVTRNPTIDMGPVPETDVDEIRMAPEQRSARQSRMQEMLANQGIDDVFEPSVATRFEERSPEPREQARSHRRESESNMGSLVEPTAPAPDANVPSMRAMSDAARSPTRMSPPPQPAAEAGPPGYDELAIGDQLDFGNTQEGLIKFVTNPAPEIGVIKCRIRRIKAGKRAHPLYVLEMEKEVEGQTQNIFLLAGKKRTGNKSSNYLISVDKTDLNKDSEAFISKLRSNFMGTEFTIYDDGVNPDKVDDPKSQGKRQRLELASCLYERNILGTKGPRKMTVLMPALDEHQRPYEVRPTQKRDTLLERNKMGRMTDLLTLYNKQPMWNEQSQSYVLNFHGRVTEASVKNFQLVHKEDEDYVILQFGRIADDTFTMDYQYPMSAVQAFAICLSSFDSKKACE